MISVRHLAKHYLVHRRPPGVLAAMRSLVHRNMERIVAVEDLSFEIAAGERVGFLGPNGAGKTTTLKMLAGLLHPTAGEAKVAGFTPHRRQTEFLRSIMLVTGQKQQLLWDLPPSETFELNRAIYDVPPAQYRQTLDELVELLAIAPLLGKPTRQLSLGERMKCELAAALLHRPRVLFLDEPTIGLDVTMQAAMRGFIRSYNERFGATVLLTSHYMDDVAALCPRVIVIDRGRLTYDGALDALAREISPDKHITLRFARAVTRAELDAVGGRVVSLGDGAAVLQVAAGSVPEIVGRALSGLPVADLKVEDAPLEDVIADLFRRNATAAAPPATPAASDPAT
jgi:ABC-2 type transport system ATP-binding protein